MDKYLLTQYAYDPSRIQRHILEELEKSSDGENIIVDPSNPFTALLEATIATTTNSLIETKSIIRRKYPILATNPDDLYHHISDDQMANMITIPGEALIVFSVNVTDMMTQGYRPTGANYVETIIPIGTEITILGYTLTLLNDILVRLYDNGDPFVEQQVNNNEIGYQDIGILEAGLTHDENGNPFIIFETLVKQVKKISRNVTITPSTGFAEIIDLNDNYYYSEVKYKNNATNKEYKYLPKTFSDEYIDPLNPHVCVSIYDKKIQFKIPDIYLVEGYISGNVQIDVYETKGKVYLPINKYLNIDYQVTLGNTTKSPQAATAPNILIWANSRSILEGGKNGLTLLELRDGIINNTTGDIDLPITEKQLIKAAEFKGFKVHKTEDTITNRRYIGIKDLPDITSNLLYSRQNIFFNPIAFSLDEIQYYKNITSLDKRTIIKSNNFFKGSNNGVVLVDNDEREMLNNLTKLNLQERLKNTKYFYNPYYYVINHNELVSSVNVYDLDNPIITNNRIIDKNINFDHRVNLKQFGIFKTDSGYRLSFNVISNEEYQKLEPETLGFQVRMLLDNDISYAYWDAKYDMTNKLWYVDLNTSINIDEDHLLDLQNGESELYLKRFKLKTHFEILSYTTNPNLRDPTFFLQNELWKYNPLAVYTVLTKERLDVTFGIHLDFIWNKIYSTYTERKYLKHKEDIPLTYDKDIYEENVDLGNIFNVEDGRLVYNVLHHKGDPVLDSEGNQLYKHRKGDIILDSNGNPIIDVMSGVIRFLDIMLLEYEFYRTTSQVYKQYKDMVLNTIRNYITQDLKDINDNLLEKTVIHFKSSHTVSDTIININNNLYSTPSIVSPRITLYLTTANNTKYSLEEMEIMKVNIGNTINKHFALDKLSLENLRQDIKTVLGSSVASVRISNIEPTNSEILNIQNTNNKFTLAKLIELDINNEYIVKYDITLELIYL